MNTTKKQQRQPRRHPRQRQRVAVRCSNAITPGALVGVTVKALLCGVLNLFLWLPGRRAN